MTKISVEQLMYMNFIKYDKMTELTNENFVGSKADTVNVFIDLYSMTRTLYRSDVAINDYCSFVSSVINLCAHIRDFFRTRYRVHTKIFIMYSDNCPEYSKRFYMNYNKKTELAIYNNEFIRDFVSNSIALLTVLCKYLHDIFFIQTKFEIGVAIYDLLMKIDMYDQMFKRKDVELFHCPTIIFSKDIYLYQIPSIVPDAVIYRSYKKDKMDMSYCINNKNVIHKFVETARTKDKFVEIVSRFNPEILSLLISLTNLPERGIKSVLNISTAINLINNGIENRHIYNGYNSDIKYVADILCSEKLKLANQSFLIENRFKAIDIRFQHSIYTNTPEAQTNMNDVVNLYDPETVKLINNKYFKNTPLDLNRL